MDFSTLPKTVTLSVFQDAVFALCICCTQREVVLTYGDAELVALIALRASDEFREKEHMPISIQSMFVIIAVKRLENFECIFQHAMPLKQILHIHFQYT